MYECVAAKCRATTMALELNPTVSSTPPLPAGDLRRLGTAERFAGRNSGSLNFAGNTPQEREFHLTEPEARNGPRERQRSSQRQGEGNALPNLRQCVKFVSSLVPAFRVRPPVKHVFVNLLSRRCALKVPPCAVLRVFTRGLFPPSAPLPNPMLGLRPRKFSSPTKRPHAQHRNPSPVH